MSESERAAAKGSPRSDHRANGVEETASQCLLASHLVEEVEDNRVLRVAIAAAVVLHLVLLVAGLTVDLDSTAAKVFIAVAACLFVPGVLLTYVWMRSRIPPQ